MGSVLEASDNDPNDLIVHVDPRAETSLGGKEEMCLIVYVGSA